VDGHSDRACCAITERICERSTYQPRRHITKEADVSTLGSPSKPYDGFDNQPIAGTWRSGHSTRHNTDIDPYTGKTLVTSPRF
jgi:hypothetical protein